MGNPILKNIFQNEIDENLKDQIDKKINRENTIHQNKNYFDSHVFGL